MELVAALESNNLKEYLTEHIAECCTVGLIGHVIVNKKCSRLVLYGLIVRLETCSMKVMDCIPLVPAFLVYRG